MKYSSWLASRHFIYLRKQQLVGSHANRQAHKTRMRVQRGKLGMNADDGGACKREREREIEEGVEGIGKRTDMRKIRQYRDVYLRKAVALKRRSKSDARICMDSFEQSDASL